MARRKLTTPEELKHAADGAQYMAHQIGNAADGFDLMTPVHGLAEHAQKFNQLAEACAKMNRMLLAKVANAEYQADMETKLAKRQAETTSRPPRGSKDKDAAPPRGQHDT